jgi:hypothetical protein
MQLLLPYRPHTHCGICSWGYLYWFFSTLLSYKTIVDENQNNSHYFIQHCAFVKDFQKIYLNLWLLCGVFHKKFILIWSKSCDSGGEAVFRSISSLLFTSRRLYCIGVLSIDFNLRIMFKKKQKSLNVSKW